MLVALAGGKCRLAYSRLRGTGRRPLVMVRRVCFCVLPARAAARQWS